MEFSDQEKSIFLAQLEEKNALPPKKPQKPRRKMSSLALFATTFLLFLFLIVFLIFVLAMGGPGNPILQFFGQNEDTVKIFLLSVVNGSFGFLSVILLMIFAIGLFFGLSFKKEEQQKRRGSFILALVSGILQFVTALIWIGMYQFVSAIVVSPGSEGGEIILILPDGTRLTPPIAKAETASLQVPVDLSFSIENIEKAIRQKKGEITALAWDFDGDGLFENPTTARTRNQRLVKSGRHEISVKIQLKDGNEVTKTIYFEIAGGTFFASPEKGYAPLDIEFDATTIARPLSGIEKFEWDFDGDSTIDEVSPGPIVSARFTKIGTSVVSLNIIDRSGQVYRFSRSVTVDPPPEDFLVPRIRTTPPLTGDTLQISKGENVLFDASDSTSTKGEIVQYEWRLSDGSKQSGKSFSRKFSEAGITEVRLTLTDKDENIREKVLLIEVQQEKSTPAIVLRTDPKEEKGVIRGNVPLSIVFDASASLDADNNIVSYEWDFENDGSIDASGSEVEHTFREAGAFETKLLVTDADQHTSEKSIQITLQKEKLTALISATPQTAELPCEIDFDGSLSSCLEDTCEISAYEWDFGDGLGKQITGAHVPHRFARIGQFIVRLTVFTSEGESATTTKNVFCRETPLKSCFTASRLRGAAPMTAVFDPSCSSGTIQKWSWDFGDGVLSESRNPSHTFQKPGRYTTTLSIIDEKNNIARYSLDLFAE